MYSQKIRVFYKPSVRNNFNWKLREFIKAERDSDTGIKEVLVETFSTNLKRKDAMKTIKKYSTYKGPNLHSLYRRETLFVRKALKIFDQKKSRGDCGA